MRLPGFLAIKNDPLKFSKASVGRGVHGAEKVKTGEIIEFYLQHTDDINYSVINIIRKITD